MTWTNILAPMLGGDPDARTLSVAKALAAPFNATITAAYAPMPPTGHFSWVNDVGLGVTDIAIGELERVSSAGEARARALLASLDYPYRTFEAVSAEDWLGLRTASRLADVVIWDRSAARAHGVFASAFREILMDERRPAIVADSPPALGGVAAIAWDGGREASRAVRRAVPLLQKARQVVVLTAPQAMAHPCEPGRVLNYLADHAVTAEARTLHSRGEAGPLILEAAHRLGASLLVAGAFGNPRLQRFIFGGTTQVLLDKSSAALLLSH